MQTTIANRLWSPFQLLRRVTNPAGAGILFLLLIQLLVFWPVWRWYVTSLLDPAEDPAVVVALLTVVVFFFLKKPERNSPQMKLIVPMILLLLYVATFHVFSPLLRAMIAVITLGYTLNSWRFGGRFQPWIYGLLLLSLPVIPPMDFYLGYPLRIIAGQLAIIILQLTGFPVVLEGLAFNWYGELFWIDVLCSGIRNLWAGLYLTYSLVAFYNLGTKKTLLITGFSLPVFIGANVLRISFLFYVKVGFLIRPWWLHNTGGLIMFLIAAIATTWFIQKLEKNV
jgi:exosortase/archaeosortase family protein